MGEAARGEQLAAILRRKLRAGPPAEGRRSLADIDGHVEHSAADHPHQLVLHERRPLEMQAAQYAAMLGHGVVVLHELRVEPVLRQQPAAVGLGEEAALVAEAAGRDQQHIGDGETPNLGHAGLVAA